ncbi:MAG: hypothetical protein LBP59_09765 [Planctomycetaceae bacterium]|jgi:hypothetical protein|nr:hypothetical protein [Planctomycetaceae bacterium]
MRTKNLLYYLPNSNTLYSAICGVCVLLVFVFGIISSYAADEKDPLLLQVIDGIKSNLDINKNLQAKFIINCTITEENLIVKYDNEVTIDGANIRVDRNEKENTVDTHVCHNNESWQYAVDNKNIKIIPIQKIDTEFVHDPREVGNVTTQSSLVEILTRYPCKNIIVTNNGDKKLIECTLILPELHVKNDVTLSLIRKMIFSSEYSYMPVLVEQYMGDLLAFTLKINYFKLDEKHGWIFDDLTYTWYNALDRLIPADGIQADSIKELCTQKINMKLSVLLLNEPINTSVFSMPKDLPDGTIIYDTIRNEVKKIGEEKQQNTKLPVSPSNDFTINWRIIFVVLGILCLIIAFIFRDKFQKNNNGRL